MHVSLLLSPVDSSRNQFTSCLPSLFFSFSQMLRIANYIDVAVSGSMSAAENPLTSGVPTFGNTLPPPPSACLVHAPNHAAPAEPEAPAEPAPLQYDSGQGSLSLSGLTSYHSDASRGGSILYCTAHGQSHLPPLPPPLSWLPT